MHGVRGHSAPNTEEESYNFSLSQPTTNSIDC